MEAAKQMSLSQQRLAIVATRQRLRGLDPSDVPGRSFGQVFSSRFDFEKVQDVPVGETIKGLVAILYTILGGKDNIAYYAKIPDNKFYRIDPMSIDHILVADPREKYKTTMKATSFAP